MDYFYEAHKFRCAQCSLESAKIQGELRAVAYALQECSFALAYLDEELLDAEAKRWVRRLQDFMDVRKQPQGFRDQGWVTQVQRLSSDDKIDLDCAVSALSKWFDDRLAV